MKLSVPGTFEVRESGALNRPRTFRKPFVFDTNIELSASA